MEAKKVNLMEGFVTTFKVSFPPHVRALMLPALIDTLATEDFAKLWTTLSPLIKSEVLSQHRSEETLSMVESWVKESSKLKAEHDLSRGGPIVEAE